MSFILADIHRYLRNCCLILGQRIFLIVWFEKELEGIVEVLWRTSPSQAFILHERMVQEIKFRIQCFLPEIHSHGCAPVPHPDSELNDALKDIGLHLYITGQVNRAYATITYLPWQGGCMFCFINKTCHRYTMSLRAKHTPI